VEANSGFVAIGAYSVKAGPVFAVIKRCVYSYVGGGACRVRAHNGDIALVEVPVCQLFAGTSLSVSVKSGCDLYGSGVPEHAGRRDVVRKGWKRVEEPVD